MKASSIIMAVGFTLSVVLLAYGLQRNSGKVQNFSQQFNSATPCEDVTKPMCEALENLDEEIFRLEKNFDSVGWTVETAHLVTTLHCVRYQFQRVCDSCQVSQRQKL